MVGSCRFDHSLWSDHADFDHRGGTVTHDDAPCAEERNALGRTTSKRELVLGQFRRPRDTTLHRARHSGIWSEAPRLSNLLHDL